MDKAKPCELPQMLACIARGFIEQAGDVSHSEVRARARRR
jgi:hypothetical protein